MELPLLKDVTGVPTWTWERGDGIRITLDKAIEGHWGQLTSMGRDPGHVKVDWSKFSGNNDEDEEEDPDEDYDSYLRSRYGITSKWGGPDSGDHPPVLGGRTPGCSFEDFELAGKTMPIPEGCDGAGDNGWQMEGGDEDEEEDDSDDEDGKGFAPGGIVKVVGLKSKPELNGQEGILKDFDQKSGRWPVLLTDGTQKLFKEDNLELPLAEDDEDKKDRAKAKAAKVEAKAKALAKRRDPLGKIARAEKWRKGMRCFFGGVRSMELLAWLLPFFGAVASAFQKPKEHETTFEMSFYPMVALLVVIMGFLDICLAALGSGGAEGPLLATFCCWLKRAFIAMSFLLYEAQYGGRGVFSDARPATGLLMILTWTTRKVVGYCLDVRTVWRGKLPMDDQSVVLSPLGGALYAVEFAAEALFMYVHCTRIPPGTQFLGSARGGSAIAKAALLCVITGNAGALTSLSWAAQAEASKGGDQASGSNEASKGGDQTRLGGAPPKSALKGRKGE